MRQRRRRSRPPRDRHPANLPGLHLHDARLDQETIIDITLRDPPRRFAVGVGGLQLSDCATLRLEPDEQVTFVTARGGEYDVARKEWGFYATPSLNGRLPGFGLRPALIQNRSSHRYFVLLVERGCEPAFDVYLAAENLRVVHWLDDEAALATIDPTRPLLFEGDAAPGT